MREHFPAGSQIAKAAWREVDGTAADRFLTTNACVCESPGGGALKDCRRQQMGLVGFHLMTKTPSAPQWIWSTFEQVDNVISPHGAPASFHSNTCRGCIPNRQSDLGFPNQTTRLIPIPSHGPDCKRPEEAVDDIARLNHDMQQALTKTGSVLRRYELISTQWPYPPAGTETQPSTVFDVRPRLLGNTTLETFVHANMPYGNGGALTVDEAWDVACFIDAQTRPGYQGEHPEKAVCSTKSSSPSSSTTTF